MKLALTALAALTLVAPAYAAEPVNMFNIDGTCESLLVDDIDLTDECKDSVLQMVYDIGRVGLYTFSGDTILTFSGASDEVIGNEIHQKLDKILIGTSADDITEIPARGTCIFENPFEGIPAQITCSASAKNGATYELSFLTNGQAPTDSMAD
jgi:hypothetical protein